MGTASTSSGLLYMGSVPEGQIRYGMDDGPSRRWELIAMAVPTTFIAVATVGLRLFTRIAIVRERISIDDYMVVAALIFSIATVVLTIKQTDYGLSYHQWDILFTDFNIWYTVYNITGTGTYALSIMFSKLSILFFYLRLSPQTWFRWCTYALISASIIYSVTFLFLNLFPCRPIQATWDYTIQASTCLDPFSSYWALSVLNVLMDVCILVLPIPVVLPLQMDRKRKLSLLLLFAAGAFVCGITIRRTAFIPNLFTSRDQSWTAVDDYLYSYAEINAGILCASVPALKPLFIHCLPARLRSRKGSGRSSYPRGTYSTNSVVEQNRRRRRMQSESIKLSSIDGSTKHGRNFSYDEDGIQLWHTSSKEEEGLEKTAVVASRPTMGTANSNSEEMRGDGFVYNVRAAAASPRPINERGITVTRETSIQYDNE
ncbi:putative Integral membrane protein [Seiridium unicorne]|uniref:Integral membrane protein n=1 Tax=Seiridium unicorne TaxID=138068 RepID=A0ABR2UPN9_9PEZI